MGLLFANTVRGEMDFGGFRPISAYPFTMLCWANLADRAAATQQCVGGLGGVTSGNQPMVTFYIGADDNWHMFMRGSAGDNTDNLDLDSGVSYTLNEWVFLCLVALSTTDFTFFVDGAKMTDSTSTQFPSGNGLSDLVLGTFTADGDTSYFRGHVQDFAAWDIALADGEVMRQYRRRQSPATAYKKPKVHVPLTTQRDRFNIGSLKTLMPLVDDVGTIVQGKTIRLSDDRPVGMKAVGKKRVAGRVVTATEGW